MTVRRALAESEHKRRLVRRRRHRQLLTGLIAVGITALTVVAVAMDRLLRPGAFPIKELRLEGEFTNLHPDTVRTSVVGQLGDNYFSLDLGRIERAVEDLPWVYQATVQRSWPHGLTIQIEEQHPVARWGDKAWLNADAQIIDLEKSVDTRGLVSLRGPDAVAADAWSNFKVWSSALLEAEVEIESIDVDDRFAWSLTVSPVQSEHAFRILLGQEEHEPRISRFLYSYQALKSKIDNLVSVDLRYPNGMAVIWRDVLEEGDVAQNEVN